MSTAVATLRALAGLPVLRVAASSQKQANAALAAARDVLRAPSDVTAPRPPPACT